MNVMQSHAITMLHAQIQQDHLYVCVSQVTLVTEFLVKVQFLFYFQYKFICIYWIKMKFFGNHVVTF